MDVHLVPRMVQKPPVITRVVRVIQGQPGKQLKNLGTIAAHEGHEELRSMGGTAMKSNE